MYMITITNSCKRFQPCSVVFEKKNEINDFSVATLNALDIYLS